ncbi:hypothetical protein A2U01_0077522, partial [Trifolium medium]|nr:hypothetical protein [Trifolium medium]
MPNNALDIV